MEEITQLYEQNRLLSDRVLQLELQLSVMQIQLTEHVHSSAIGKPILFEEQQLEDPPPDYHNDGLD
jgi:hypothetical protein